MNAFVLHLVLSLLKLTECWCFLLDFTFSSESCGGGAVGSGGGGRGSSLDQDSLGGGIACEEHEVASLTTLHIDSETSSLSHTVTVTGGL